MEAISQDQFKVNHLRQRIAALTVKHEDELTQNAIQLQLVVQERDDLRQKAGALANELVQTKDELERLQRICGENEVKDNPDDGEKVADEED